MKYPTDSNQAKILFFDIEVAGIGNGLKADMGFVILFGYKWANENKVNCLSVADYDGLGSFSDKKLLQAVSKIWEQADLVVAHFGSVFDRRFIQGRLLLNGLPPIPNTKLRDTCLITRSIATFSRNSLGHLSRIFNFDNQKMDSNWPKDWMRVMAGDERALNRLEEYCKGDVLALEELYNKIKAFDVAHPRVVSDRSKCGLCGSNVEYRGYAYLENRKYRRFVCKNSQCRKWSREVTAMKD